MGIFASFKKVNADTFIHLLKVGLWNEPINQYLFSTDTDWETIKQFAFEQTVIGLITEGASHLPREKQGQRQLMLEFYKQTADIEEDNKKMNRFVPYLIEQLERKGVNAILLKGQGVAANYNNPLRRVVGDIDLLVPDAYQYEKAKELMSMIATIDGEDVGRKHAAYKYQNMLVEIHGDFRFLINRTCEKHLDEWKKMRLNGDKRVINNNFVNGLVVPSVDFDVVFVFAHMLGHLMGSGGVGLRQVCDWMMFVNKNYGEINKNFLIEDLDLLGLTEYWKVFGAMAVCELDYPKDFMPLYDETYVDKGKQVLNNILFTGNFGARQKGKHLSSDSNVILKKLVTLFGEIPVYARNFKIFPKDTLWCFYNYVKLAINGYQS